MTDCFEESQADNTSKDESPGDSNGASNPARKSWAWLKKTWLEERKMGTTLHNKPPWTRKRKHSVVDPFLKRFSTRELHGINPSSFTQNNEARLLKQDQLNTPQSVWENQAQSRTSSVSLRHQKGFFRTGVFDPKSSFIFYWNYLLVLSIFYHLWTIIFRIAFLEGSGTSGNEIIFLVFDYIIDVVFIIDIIISSRISFLQNGILVKDVKRVVFTYLFTKAFFVDVLSILPVDLLYIIFGVTPILRLVRLIKVYRLLKIKNAVESMSSYPALLRASILVHSMLLLIHWNAGFYYMISKSEGFGSNDWVYPALNGTYMSSSTKYARSFYWATLTLTAIGDLPAPETNVEYLYTICCYLCGIFMFATVVGNIGSIILNRNSTKIMFEQHRDQAKSYMEERKVPKVLQERVLLWYDYAFQRGRINGVDDLNSLSLLPDKMRTELAIHIHLDTLKKVSFLQSCQPEFLHDLLLKMKLIIYTPDDLIIRRGEIAREMYLISDGIVQIIGESGNVLKELGTGDFFGEIGILNLSGGQNRRIADVRSVGYTECFMLLREDVLAATRDYPAAQAILAAYGRERLNRTRKISAPLKERGSASLRSKNGLQHFELQVLRESVTSTGTENQGFMEGENHDEVNKKTSVNQETSHGNNSLPRNKVAPLPETPREEKTNATKKDFESTFLELNRSIELKNKEISLLDDVIKQLQSEKESQAAEILSLSTEIDNVNKKQLKMEEQNSRLKDLNQEKEDLIEGLKMRIGDLERRKTLDDVVVTEVNELEESC